MKLKKLNKNKKIARKKKTKIYFSIRNIYNPIKYIIEKIKILNFKTEKTLKA